MAGDRQAVTYLVTAKRGSQFATVCAVDLAEVQTGLTQFFLNHPHVVLRPANSNILLRHRSRDGKREGDRENNKMLPHMI